HGLSVVFGDRFDEACCVSCACHGRWLYMCEAKLPVGSKRHGAAHGHLPPRKDPAQRLTAACTTITMPYGPARRSKVGVIGPATSRCVRTVIRRAVATGGDRDIAHRPCAGLVGHTIHG